MGNKVTSGKPKITTYTVKGKTLKEVWTNVLKVGPKDPNDNKKVAALTECTIIVADKWDAETRGGRCMTTGKIETRVGVKNMTMKVEGVIKLPKLSGTGLSKTAKKEWDRFMSKLDKHEREHLVDTEKLAKTMGVEIMKIEGVGLGDDEDKAFEAGKAAFIKLYVASYSGKKISDRITAAAKKLDKASDHGAKHGAVLNLDIT